MMGATADIVMIAVTLVLVLGGAAIVTRAVGAAVRPGFGRGFLASISVLWAVLLFAVIVLAAINVAVLMDGHV